MKKNKWFIWLLSSFFFSMNLLAQSYIDNGDGTVTQKGTGLMWQSEPVDSMIWKEAVKHCRKLNLSELEDWRLPTIRELKSLINISDYAPAIDTRFFRNSNSAGHWSSTQVKDKAWQVDFFRGAVSQTNKLYGRYTRCVRDINKKNEKGEVSQGKMER